MKYQGQEVDALTFKKGEERATIVTTGALFVVYVDSEMPHVYMSINRAISNLEARGYSIMMDEWT